MSDIDTDHKRRPCVLIVDDSPVALAVLEAVLRGEHYEVVTASDGVDGYEKAVLTKPDLLITDGMMPGADGFELVRLLRQDPATRLIPVIMLTSGDIRETEVKNRVPQPDAFFAKSMHMAPLLDRVKVMLVTASRTSR